MRSQHFLLQLLLFSVCLLIHVESAVNIGTIKDRLNELKDQLNFENVAQTEQSEVVTSIERPNDGHLTAAELEGQLGVKALNFILNEEQEIEKEKEIINKLQSSNPSFSGFAVVLIDFKLLNDFFPTVPKKQSPSAIYKWKLTQLIGQAKYTFASNPKFDFLTSDDKKSAKIFGFVNERKKESDTEFHFTVAFALKLKKQVDSPSQSLDSIEDVSLPEFKGVPVRGDFRIQLIQVFLLPKKTSNKSLFDPNFANLEKEFELLKQFNIKEKTIDLYSKGEYQDAIAFPTNWTVKTLMSWFDCLDTEAFPFISVGFSENETKAISKADEDLKNRNLETEYSANKDRMSPEFFDKLTKDLDWKSKEFYLSLDFLLGKKMLELSDDEREAKILAITHRVAEFCIQEFKKKGIIIDNILEEAKAEYKQIGNRQSIHVLVKMSS